MKKFRFLILAVLALSLVVCFAVACGDETGGDTGSGSTYTFEAEGVDFTGLSSFGYSINISETDMIMGKNTPSLSDTVVNSLSGGYFAGYFNTKNENGLTLKFPITADKASENNTITLRLGTEYGTITISPGEMDVIVNGTALQYDPITVVGKNLTSVTQFEGYTVPFNDYKLSSKFALKAGENTVELKIKVNTLGFDDEPMLRSVGPGVDCIKIRSESALTWESLWEDNKLQAGITG